MLEKLFWEFLRKIAEISGKNIKDTLIILGKLFWAYFGNVREKL